VIDVFLCYCAALVAYSINKTERGGGGGVQDGLQAFL